MVNWITPPINFTQLVCTFILILGSAYAMAEKASITLELETDEVYIGDTITITVESIGLIDPLDTSILSQSARYERETYGTRIFVQGGKVVDVNIRRMEFTATKTGPIVFGPVTSGDINSNSVSVKVLGAVRKEWEPAQDDLTIDVSISNQQPYVHAQLVLDIRLEHQFVVADESIELPAFNGFIVKPVYQQRRTFTDNSQQRRKIEWRYLLFAERSGDIEIGPVHWQGSIVKSRPERATFVRHSNPTQISVAPSALNTSKTPNTLVTDWWLPSSNLQISENWSTELTALKAGDEIVRRIFVNANDVLASQIPAPTVLESRALSQTLINETRNEEITETGVVASAEFTYRLYAKSPIPVFLDTVRIPWWNTTTDTAEEEIIPARRINVALPDRVDLLKNIAQETTGTSAFKLWWADASLTRLLIAGIGALLLLPVFVGVCRHLLARYRIYKYKKDILSNLRQLTLSQKWAELGVAVNAVQGLDGSDSCQLILMNLYPVLYGTHGNSIDISAITGLIDTINLNLAVTRENISSLVPL